MTSAEGTQPEKEALTMETLVRGLQKVSKAEQASLGDRYLLKPLTFGGDGDVEQFIRDFDDVATIAKWPVLVRLLQLQTCLTHKAKCHDVGPVAGHIF